jgi:putative acetyltransferase
MHDTIVRISLESPNQSEVLSLIEHLDAYQRPLYPAESYHGIDVGALSDKNVLFAVARSGEGQVVACGAIVLELGYGEVKRMFTVPGFRSRGIAGRLLAFLESEARSRGCRQFMLETGFRQLEAIALYERFGYMRCAPFGNYAEDPNSVFMAKFSRVDL